MARKAVGVAIALALTAFGPAATAQGRIETVTTAPDSQQRALGVGLMATPSGYRIFARICATSNCPVDEKSALSVQPPAGIGPTAPRLQSLRIGGGRWVVHVDVSTATGRWQAIVAAPLSGVDPLVIWSGATPETPIDDRPRASLQVVTDATGNSQVLVGEVREELQLCGRPTLLSPRVVHTDLSLRPVKLQRLSLAEREAAESVVAVGVEQVMEPLGRLLVATGASSGHGSPSALSDGNLETPWSEGRGKEGRGEFVVFRAPSDVAIASLSLTIRPRTAMVEQGAAPRTVYLAADGRLIRVTLPEDGWKHPGKSYSVTFAQPLETSCLAVVLDDAFVPLAATDPRVTLSEVTAYSVFDGKETHASLARALGGNDKRAAAAASILLRGGDPAVQAVVEHIHQLDASGRHHAMQVLDAAPCSVSSPVFASLLSSEVETERGHARDRIQRCGRSAASALEQVLRHGAGCAPSYRNEAQCEKTMAAEKRHALDAGRLAAADELATVAPERVVPWIAFQLGKMNRPTRRALRGYLARATSKPRGRNALALQLMNESLSVPARIDLLRVAKENLEGIRGPASVAFSRLATPNATLRTRTLLQDTAAQLARQNDEYALWYLRTSVTKDPEPMVRTQAVTASRGIVEMQPWLMAALEDEQVRVREAAAQSLAGTPEAVPYLVRRLMLDPWPMVRAAAARSLANSGPSSLADQELGRRLQDDAPLVRQWAATALGIRGAVSQTERLRAMADDSREKVTVRIVAVHALGELCDSKSVDLLTIFAARSTDPYSPEAASGLGAACVAALGRLHPPDLARRLDPLISRPGVPAHIRSAAAEALSASNHCSSPR